MPTEIVVDYVSPDRRGGQGNQKVPIASYTLALLSAQTPVTIAGCPVVGRVHDEQASGPYRPDVAKPDILCLTYLTTGAPRAYDLSDKARQTKSHAGAPIVVIHGGVHATSLPQEALVHAQFVVRGEIGRASQAVLFEKAWEMRRDRSLKGTFRMAETTKTIRRPLADWSWMDPRKYLLPYPTTQTSTGCPFGCEFCSVTEVFGAAMRTIDRDDIYRQLGQFKPGSIVPVIDDNFLQGVQPSHVNHCIIVAVMMRDLGLSWVTEVTVRTIIEAEAKIRCGDHGYALPKGKKSLIEFFAEHGCRGFFFGIEEIGGAGATLKKSRSSSETIELIRRCQNNGIAVLGAFVLGVGPEETPDYAKRLLHFAIEEARLDFAQFSINTPMPGAQNFLTGMRDGTIFDFNWELYDAEHCVMRHPVMKRHELETWHNWLCREFYAHRSIISRYRPTGLIEPGLWKRFWPIGLGANLALHRNHKGWNNRLANSDRPKVIPQPHPTVLDQVAQSLNGRGTVDLFNIARPDRISEILPAG